MPLFPESEKWVYTTLINPTTNEVNQQLIKIINGYIALTTNKQLSDWTFDEFVILLNGILSLNPNETEEMVLFNNEIINRDITRYILVLYINNWDLCGILIIIKKMMDEKITTCHNPLEFIENTISLLTPVTNIVDEDSGLSSTYFPKNFTYSEIENDEFMSGLFENVSSGINPITISNVINNEEYSFLLLNENFKRRIYGAIDEEIFNEIEPYIINIDFIRTLLKYQPKALRFVGDIWRNNREIVILAVSNDGLALQFATNEFKSDREIVLLSVKNNAKSLIFASDEIIVSAANSIIDGIV